MTFRYIARICTDVRTDCQDRVGEACNFQGWKDNDHQGPFCKNYRRCENVRSQEVRA